MKNPRLSRSLAVEITENCSVAVKVSPRSQASGPETNTGDEVTSLAVQTLPMLLNEGRQLVPLIGSVWASVMGEMTNETAQRNRRAGLAAPDLNLGKLECINPLTPHCKAITQINLLSATGQDRDSFEGSKTVVP